MHANLTQVARRLDFIRETEGPNRGYWVNFLQRFCGGSEGDSWCAQFESLVEDIAYKGHNPTPRTGSCDMKFRFCRRMDLLVNDPQVNDIYFYVNPAGVAHHIGIVSKVSGAKVWGIAGNTSVDGKSSNGDGVYEHEINVAACTFARLPV